MTAETLEAAEDTFAAIAERLGNIPLERIIWLPREATEEDAVRFCGERRLVELIEGLVVEKPMGYREAFLAGSLIMFLKIYVSPRKLGLVGGADAIVRLGPGLIRLPDVSFVSWERLLPTNAHKEKVGPLAPDLAVEILSEGNTRKEMIRKRRELLEAGTKIVWIIDPKKRTAEVYDDPEQPDQMHLVGEGDSLDGGTVLPGFRLPLAELFADIEPPTAPSTP